MTKQAIDEKARVDLVLCFKGGEGKSTITNGIGDNLLRAGNHFILVDSDSSNEDCGLKFKKYPNTAVTVMRFNLDIEAGWELLVDAMQDNPGERFLIDVPARSDGGIEKNASFFKRTFTKLNRRLISWWVLNRQKKSIESLEKYITLMPPSENHTIHTIINTYWGDSSKFHRWSDHPLSKRFDGQDLGFTVTYPELGDRSADYLNDNELTISAGIEKAPKVSTQSLLEDYRNNVDATFEELL